MQAPPPDRRSFLRTLGDLAQGVAAAGFMRAALSAPGAVLLKAGRVFAALREPLIQPSEISSQDGILSTNLTAAIGRMQLVLRRFSLQRKIHPAAPPSPSW